MNISYICLEMLKPSTLPTNTTGFCLYSGAKPCWPHQLRIINVILREWKNYLPFSIFRMNFSLPQGPHSKIMLVTIEKKLILGHGEEEEKERDRK